MVHQVAYKYRPKPLNTEYSIVSKSSLNTRLTWESECLLQVLTPIWKWRKPSKWSKHKKAGRIGRKGTSLSPTNIPTENLFDVFFLPFFAWITCFASFTSKLGVSTCKRYSEAQVRRLFKELLLTIEYSVLSEKCLPLWFSSIFIGYLMNQIIPTYLFLDLLFRNHYQL